MADGNIYNGRHEPRGRYDVRPRYVPPSLDRIVAMVADMSDLSVAAICGPRRQVRLVHARSVITMLVLEYHPRISSRVIDDALQRDCGMAGWYETRHEDRLKLYPEYKELYEHCHRLMERQHE